MGDKLRFSPEGPRELNEEDFRFDDKAKVVQNSSADVISSKAKFEPVIPAEHQQRLVAILDARGGTQRGKARSKDPNRNPLGGRVFDMNCSWPMYRRPFADSFRYVCAAYTQSHGARCDHNWVDGKLAVRFILGCMQQRLFGLETKLESRLRELAERDSVPSRQTVELRASEEMLAKTVADLKLVTNNLALAANPEQFGAISQKFDQLTARKKTLEAAVAADRAGCQPRDVDAEVLAALGLARRLANLSKDEANLPQITQLLQLTNARIFLSFRNEQLAKRKVNRIVSGVLTFGNAQPPIAVYQGPTSRNKLAATSMSTDVAAAPAPPKLIGTGEEGNSLGNVNRGD